MQNTAVTFNLILKLLVSDQSPVTDLVPPAPLLQYEQFDTTVPLPEEALAIVPHQTATINYEALKFADPLPQQMQQPPSWFGTIMEMLNGKLMNVESRLYDSLKDRYQTTVDEVDQATFRQLFLVGQWAAKIWGPLIRRKLVEGTFISLSDQGDYHQAFKFAYTHMWQMNQRLLAGRLFIFALQDYEGLAGLKQKVRQQIDSDQEMSKIWQLRWKDSRQMTAFMPYLHDYQTICREVLAEPKLLDLIQGNLGIKYHYMARLFEVESLIAELRASYFNKMLSTKQQSDFSGWMQDSLNYLAFGISLLSGGSRVPRKWDDLTVATNLYIAKTLKELVKSYAKNYPANEAFQKYINAIKEDRLIYAKWLSQTMAVESNLDWEREVQDFGNYCRTLLKLLDIYHYVEDIICNMMQLQTDTFEKIKQPEVFMDSQKVIRTAFLFLREIDKLRVQMRLGYLKKIKTDINTAEIEWFERIVTSFNNKLQRYFMEGNIIDQTLTYSQVMQGSFEDVLTKFNDVTHCYESYLIRVREKVEVAIYQRDLSNFRKKLNDNKKYYPVFFNFERLKKFMDGSIDLKQSIKVFIYNLQRQFKKEESRAALIPQETVQKFIDYIQTITACQERLDNLATSLSKINESSQLWYCEAIEEIGKICELTITNLYDSFVKYVISENNRQNSLTIRRVATSASNKFWRWRTKGVIYDTTPEYPTIISKTENSIQNIQSGLDKIESDIKAESERVIPSSRAISAIQPKQFEINENYLL